MADIWSKRSKCQRRQVGALLVKDSMIISDGYNGTPHGYDNDCENKDGTTAWYTLHAESNAITKCAKHGRSSKGATLYMTMAPCKQCAKLIIQAGISEVVYRDDYHDKDGIRFLINNYIKVRRYES